MSDNAYLLPDKGGLRFGALGDNWVHVCVDMQRMFAEATAWHAEWMPRVLPEVVRLAERAPERTIFTRFIPPATVDELPGTWRRYYLRWPSMKLDRLDPELVDLVPELRSLVPPGRLLDKQVYSPWFGGRMTGALRNLPIDTMVVSGTETEVCVLATVLGAIDHGYRVIIATDAVCSSADSTHDAMLEIYHSRFGMQVEAVTVREILEAT
jgi:nicotinamidase-related amidase